jgi:hypothetical protein
MNMVHGGTSSAEALDRGPKSRFAYPVATAFWAIQQAVRITAPLSATARNVVDAVFCFMQKPFATRIAQTSANLDRLSVKIAPKHLSPVRMLRVVSVAFSVITSSVALLAQFVMQALGTKSSKFLLAPRGPRRNTAQAEINGCLSIAGSCSKNLAGSLGQRKASITSTESAMTTGLKTLNFGSDLSLLGFVLPTITVLDVSASRFRVNNASGIFAL